VEIYFISRFFTRLTGGLGKGPKEIDESKLVFVSPCPKKLFVKNAAW
jgi:hypothetical protein